MRENEEKMRRKYGKLVKKKRCFGIFFKKRFLHFEKMEIMPFSY
jgi:hypothetical protein